MIKSVATKRNLYGTTWNICKKTWTTLEHVGRIRRYRTFLQRTHLEWGRKWSISFSSFLESSEWLGKRSAILPSLRDLKRAILDFCRPRSHTSRHSIRAMILGLLGMFFYDTSTMHRFGFRCSSLVFVLKKGYNGQCEMNRIVLYQQHQL